MLFANAPQDQVKAALHAHGLDPDAWTEWVTPYPALVIDTGAHRVLVDTGMGGRLPELLQAEGRVPGDFDTVILTHAHPDHIGGNVDSSGHPRYANARYVMWKTEWEFWTAEASLAQMPASWAECARRQLPPIQRQLQLIDRETEIVPGISAVEAAGHTPGHMVVAVISGGTRLLYFSDVLLHQVHVEQPDWYATVDHSPEGAISARRRLLTRVAADKALVHSFHFPFPGLGYVTRQEMRWVWQPIADGGAGSGSG
jgi:glyoxylase-like metal-dependent hydrolase (beta-lactamase superfamily II)